MRSLRTRTLLTIVFVATVAFPAGQSAAIAQEGDDNANVTVDPRLYEDMSYRSLNFSRGGRAVAVSGVVDSPLTYYMGATGGGVWKTDDAGNSWNNISDGFFGVGSIGAIEVAPSDPNVIWVGTGEGCPRGNVAIGDGIYRSTDAGKSWMKSLDLDANIGKLVVHPTDHDTVWVAVIGNIFGDNEDRGVYKTTDGGMNWEKVLYIDENTGFVDVEIDPNNPRILLASAWTVRRSPWSIDSGSEDDGVYRSKDGGTTWEKLGGGLPDGMVGRSSVAISPANSDRMWVLIEASDDRGGVFRSDNGGDTWNRINSTRALLQRAWYYIHIYADPKDENTVYALNTGFYKSIDGGKTFDIRLRPPHGDNHDLWINPENPQVMVNANDGGANVSFNGGGSWSHQRNQPTAQMYRVSVDEAWPYRVYGAQQDNSTARLSSLSRGGFGGGGFGAAFESVGGGESGHIAVDPRGNEVVYAGSYGGTITRRDMETGLSENVRAYPESQTGQQALDMEYRFQWNAPIRISPHNPDAVYHTSQYVHRTTDDGRSWEVISPDLTYDDPETQGYSGSAGITRDNTGVEVFNTIFAFEESHHAAGLMWAGTDDGRMWLTRDDGTNWTEITPEDMPVRGTVNTIDVSAHDPGRIHIAVHKYRENDFTPYIFRTSDYGASWELLTDGTNGIPADHWVRTVREDPDRQGLLYAGTEFGVYVSFDGGAHWQSLQLNLPQVPITEILVHRKDLVVATQGRAFYILDDLSPLHQVQAGMENEAAALLAPRDAFRGLGGPVAINYWLSEVPESGVKIEIVNGDGDVVREYSSSASSDPSSMLPAGMSLADVPPQFRRQLASAGGSLEPESGMNQLTWNGRHDALFRRPRGIVMWGGGGTQGPKAVPGDYTVRMTVGDDVQEQAFTLGIDPRRDATVADYERQYDLVVEVGEQLDEVWTSLEGLRRVKGAIRQIGGRVRGQDGADEIVRLGRQITGDLEEIEKVITQVEGEGGQDALNFPGRLDNQWAALYGAASGPDTPLTAGVAKRQADLQPETDELLERLAAIYAGPLIELNTKISALNLDAISLPE
ncbi:MAG: glycosyl hydrolase [Acidobacteria bacterium]|nr:glycosyl hydrolase [Acidobacteriota bacterium]